MASPVPDASLDIEADQERTPANGPSRGYLYLDPKPGSMAPSHVLVPLDGSPLSDDALEHALETFDCTVTVVNVVTGLDSVMAEGGLLEPGEHRQESAEERAERLVSQARDRAAERDQHVETTVETGDPAETIVEYATEHGVDHIVMGGHGGDRSELARRLLGTVATSVVGEAPMTVTVVR